MKMAPTTTVFRDPDIVCLPVGEIFGFDAVAQSLYAQAMTRTLSDKACEFVEPLRAEDEPA
jgi:hypothetical protein